MRKFHLRSPDRRQTHFKLHIFTGAQHLELVVQGFDGFSDSGVISSHARCGIDNEVNVNVAQLRLQQFDQPLDFKVAFIDIHAESLNGQQLPKGVVRVEAAFPDERICRNHRTRSSASIFREPIALLLLQEFM